MHSNVIAPGYMDVVLFLIHLVLILKKAIVVVCCQFAFYFDVWNLIVRNQKHFDRV